MDDVIVENAAHGSHSSTSPANTSISSPVIVDTGSTFIIGDPDKVSKLYAQITGAQSIGKGLYTVPCDAVPTISLVFGGRAFPIDPTVFNQGPITNGSTQCLGGVVAPSNSTKILLYWTVGYVFLRNVYTVYQMTDGQCTGQVGFATPAQGVKSRESSGGGRASGTLAVVLTVVLAVVLAHCSLV